MELNDTQRLAIAQAFYKAAAELVDTKNPDSLRSKVDAGYRELYELTGSKSFDVLIDGHQVGTYSIRFSKPKPEETHASFEVTDYEKLARDFAENVTDEQCRKFVALNLSQFAEWTLNTDGELMDGCKVMYETTEATEKQYLGGTLKVDPQEVMVAMGETLPPGIAGLLGGGYEQVG